MDKAKIIKSIDTYGLNRFDVVDQNGYPIALNFSNLERARYVADWHDGEQMYKDQ